MRRWRWKLALLQRGRRRTPPSPRGPEGVEMQPPPIPPLPPPSRGRSLVTTLRTWPCQPQAHESRDRPPARPTRRRRRVPPLVCPLRRSEVRDVQRSRRPRDPVASASREGPKSAMAMPGLTGRGTSMTWPRVRPTREPARRRVRSLRDRRRERGAASRRRPADGRPGPGPRRPTASSDRSEWTGRHDASGRHGKKHSRLGQSASRYSVPRWLCSTPLCLRRAGRGEAPRQERQRLRRWRGLGRAPAAHRERDCRDPLDDLGQFGDGRGTAENTQPIPLTARPRRYDQEGSAHACVRWAGLSASRSERPSCRRRARHPNKKDGLRLVRAETQDRAQMLQHRRPSDLDLAELVFVGLDRLRQDHGQPFGCEGTRDSRFSATA